MSGYFCTQAWERDWLDGVTPLSAGAVFFGFEWEAVLVGVQWPIVPVGELRRAISPDRQYLAQSPDQHGLGFTGRANDIRSSSETLLVLEVVLPDTDLDDASVPMILPEPLMKYVRYGVLADAFSKPGQGRNALLADHYARRVARGVTLFRRLGDVAHRDRVYQREAIDRQARTRVPHVRLPAQFPVTD